MLKILVVGNSSTGKTTFIKQFVHNRYEPPRQGTLNSDISLKVIRMGDSELRLNIWELVGSADPRQQLNGLFCRNATGIMLVYDILDQKSRDDLLLWKQRIDDIVTLPNGNPLPCIVVANKYDKIEEYDSKLEIEMTEAGI